MSHFAFPVRLVCLFCALGVHVLGGLGGCSCLLRVAWWVLGSCLAPPVVCPCFFVLSPCVLFRAFGFACPAFVGAWVACFGSAVSGFLAPGLARPDFP